jgi:hypothetical protein
VANSWWAKAAQAERERFTIITNAPAQREIKGCKKKAVKKDYIEQLVIVETRQMIMQDEIIERLADAVMDLQKRENTALPLLQQQLTEAEKGIENILNAIQQGVLTTSTKQRLEALEQQKEDLEISIAQEQIQRPLLTREKIIFGINKFRDGDIDDPKHRQNLIDIFVNSVYVYSDRLIITCNYKDGAKTVTLTDIKGSDIVEVTPPVGVSLQHLRCCWGAPFLCSCKR